MVLLPGLPPMRRHAPACSVVAPAVTEAAHLNCMVVAQVDARLFGWFNCSCGNHLILNCCNYIAHVCRKIRNLHIAHGLHPLVQVLFHDLCPVALW